MPNRRLLVVSYYAPPLAHVGANRWDAMARHLRTLGHEVTVLTTSAYGSCPDDEERGVVRAYDLVGSQRLRALLGRASEPGTDPPDPSGRPAEPSGPPRLERLVPPDPYAATWAPWAVAAARHLCRQQRIDCVITTSPPDSAHLVGLGLGPRRPAWIMDLRDPWLYSAPHKRRSRAERWLGRRLETALVRRADGIIAVARPVAEDLRRRLGVSADWIPHGWDPTREPDDAGDAPVPPGAKPLLVHTGTLSRAWGRDPRPLWEAVRSLLAGRPALRQHLRIVLAGRVGEADRQLITEHGLDDVVVVVGHLERSVALALQRRADALLLLSSPVVRTEAPGKLIEYLGARRPVIALAEGNETARLVQERGLGVAVPPRDTSAITVALESAVDGTLGAAYAPRGVDDLIFPRPAEAVGDAIERAISRRAARARPAARGRSAAT